MQTKSKTFVLGLGHQKCGTSWLHAYLAQSPEFAQGPTKEFHIWDGVDIPAHREFRADVSWIRKLIGAVRKRKFAGKLRQLRYQLQRDTATYCAYFDTLMVNGKTISADITPSYSALGADRLVSIKNEMEALEINVKPVIFIRDPLSRIKSAVRFNLDRGNTREGVSDQNATFEAALEAYYETPFCELRTNYDHSIETARQVFGPDNVHVGVYEAMFEETEIRRLSKFLGIAPKLEFAKVEVNKTKNAVSRTPLDEKIRRHYGHVYDYCHTNVPETVALWSE